MIRISCFHVVPYVNHKRIMLKYRYNDYYSVDTFRNVFLRWYTHYQKLILILKKI